MPKKPLATTAEVEVPEVLPTNLLAEQEVLGALIEEPGLLPDVIGGLSAGDFSLADHRRVFLAISELEKSGSTIDFVTVAERLGNREHDIAVMAQLISGVVLVRGHILSHVAILRKKSRLRSLAKLGRWLMDSACLRGADPEEIIRLVAEQCSGGTFPEDGFAE